MSPFGLLLARSHKYLSSILFLRYRLAGVKFVFSVAFAAITSLSTPAARAYVLEGKSWPAGSVVILQLGLGSAGKTLQDGNTSWDNAVAPVAAMWNQQVQRVQLTNVANPLLPPSSGDHLNSVVFSSTVFGQSFGSSTLAVTYYTSIGSNMVESDTLFNRAQTFDSYRGPLQFIGHGPAIADIRRVFLHELGHTLGLGHPDTSGQQVAAVMNSVVSNQEILSADDISGGQYLYGAPLLPTPTPTPPPPTPTPTPNPTPTPTPSPTTVTSHIVNISTRMRVGLNQNVMIGGFIIKGSQSKTLILRAMGPSLAAGGVQNVLEDPVLELHDATGAVIARNDDWRTGSQAAQITATGLAPTNPAESALIVALAPGNYTAVISGYQGGQGVGLVEAYELDNNSTRLVNISTRGRVDVGDDAMIGGLIVQGDSAKRVILRAIGPSLAGGSNPVPGALADPTLELRDAFGNLLAANDNWVTSTQSAEIVASTIPPSHPLESAIVATLGAGNYTGIVRGVNNTAGVALVEVYDLDP